MDIGAGGRLQHLLVPWKSVAKTEKTSVKRAPDTDRLHLQAVSQVLHSHHVQVWIRLQPTPSRRQ